MIYDAYLVASKDLAIEWRSKVLIGQVLPFSLIILLMFGIAIPDDLLTQSVSERSALTQVAPGLYWVTILFVVLFALARSFAIEAKHSTFDAIRLSGIDPASIFLGKSAAIAIQMFLLQISLGVIGIVLFNVIVVEPLTLLVTLVSATFALAAVGVLYSAMSVGAKSSETLNALLILPALVPVMLAATRSTETAVFAENSSVWGWTLLLSGLAALYTGVGIIAFEPLMEES